MEACLEVRLYQFIVVNEGFLYFVDEGFLYFVNEGFLYFEDMNAIHKSHFLFPIKEPFWAEQLTKNLIQ